MKFVNNLEIGKRIIQEKYPEFSKSSFKADNSGWDNFVIKVDNEYIFRFPRDEGAYRTIKMEYAVLGYLNNELPNNIKVPKFIFSNLREDYPFVGYKMIKGEFLSKELFERLTDEEKDKFIDNMISFINILHSLDIDKHELDHVEPISNYKMRYNEFKEKCFKYFDNELIEKTNKLFNNYFNNKEMHTFKPTIVHGDLSTDHIILTDDGIGIIDFGDTRVFDPAYDFSWVFQIDENIFDGVIEKYKVNKDENFKKRIKDFYLPLIPYYGMVFAEESNNEKMLKGELEKIKKYEIRR